MYQETERVVFTIFAAFILPFASTYLITRLLIPFLRRRGIMAKDVHKEGEPKIPRPGGPAIIISIVLAEVLLFNLTGSPKAVALGLVVVVSGVIGIVDDLFTLRGVVKPIILVLASLPLLFIPGVFSPYPVFPIFGGVRLTLIYPILVLLAIPVTSNTINTIDVLNGVVSSFVAVATIPLIFALLLKADYIDAALTTPLLASAVAFYLLHRYPSRIFPGDSGSLAMGALYGAIAITGGVEMVAVAAILPAILNSFFFLSSVKRIVEHREVKERPVAVGDDGLLRPSRSPTAPITLVRMILADGPLNERQVTSAIFRLTVFSALLACLTALATWWSPL